jgi:hypothetical protein
MVLIMIRVLIALVKRRNLMLQKQMAIMNPGDDDNDKELKQLTPTAEKSSDTASVALENTDGDALSSSELLLTKDAANDVDDNDKTGTVPGFCCLTRCCPALLRVSLRRS